MVVNYIREVSAFMAFQMEEELSGSAQLLWHALMHVANSRGQGGDWPESIRISNRKLLLFLPFSEDTLSAARDELAAAARIRYTPGSKRERPVYEIVYFSTELSTSTGDCPGNNPGNDPKFSGESAELIQTRNTYAYESVDDDEEIRARAEAPAADHQEEERVTAVRQAWREYIGPEALRSEAERFLVQIAGQLKLPPGIIREAIHAAAFANARAPAAYAAQVMTDWAEEGVRSLSDLGELQVMRDVHRGRLQDGCGPVTADDLAEARRRRLERGA